MGSIHWTLLLIAAALLAAPTQGFNVCRYYNPCENGGTCEPSSEIPYFSCRCPNSTYGFLCTGKDDSSSGISKRGLPENPCKAKPCFNGGSCISLVQGYVCMCPAGFAGASCSVRAKRDLDPSTSIDIGNDERLAVPAFPLAIEDGQAAKERLEEKLKIQMELPQTGSDPFERFKKFAGLTDSDLGKDPRTFEEMIRDLKKSAGRPYPDPETESRTYEEIFKELKELASIPEEPEEQPLGILKGVVDHLTSLVKESPEGVMIQDTDAIVRWIEQFNLDRKYISESAIDYCVPRISYSSSDDGVLEFKMDFCSKTSHHTIVFASSSSSSSPPPPPQESQLQLSAPLVELPDELLVTLKENQQDTEAGNSFDEMAREIKRIAAFLDEVEKRLAVTDADENPPPPPPPPPMPVVVNHNHYDNLANWCGAMGTISFFLLWPPFIYYTDKLRRRGAKQPTGSS